MPHTWVVDNFKSSDLLDFFKPIIYILNFGSFYFGVLLFV